MHLKFANFSLFIFVALSFALFIRILCVSVIILIDNGSTGDRHVHRTTTATTTKQYFLFLNQRTSRHTASTSKIIPSANRNSPLKVFLWPLSIYFNKQTFPFSLYAHTKSTGQTNQQLLYTLLPRNNRRGVICILSFIIIVWGVSQLPFPEKEKQVRCVGECRMCGQLKLKGKQKHFVNTVKRFCFLPAHGWKSSVSCVTLAMCFKTFCFIPLISLENVEIKAYIKIKLKKSFLSE